MLRFRSLLPVSIPLLLSACATATASFEPLGPNHPGSPEAPIVPIADPAACLRAEGDAVTGAADPTAPPAADAPAASAGAYVCPMHVEVSSDEPGRCPVCGMKLVRREPSEPAQEDPPHDG